MILIDHHNMMPCFVYYWNYHIVTVTSIENDDSVDSDQIRLYDDLAKTTTMMMSHNFLVKMRWTMIAFRYHNDQHLNVHSLDDRNVPFDRMLDVVIVPEMMMVVVVVVVVVVGAMILALGFGFYCYYYYDRLQLQPLNELVSQWKEVAIFSDN